MFSFVSMFGAVRVQNMQAQAAASKAGSGRSCQAHFGLSRSKASAKSGLHTECLHLESPILTVHFLSSLSPPQPFVNSPASTHLLLFKGQAVMRHTGLHQRPESLAGATRADTGSCSCGSLHGPRRDSPGTSSCSVVRELPVQLSSSSGGRRRTVITGR